MAVVWQEVNYTLGPELPQPKRGRFTRDRYLPDPADLAAIYRQSFF